MKILVTGCLGFIGYHFISKLSKKYEIVGVDWFKKNEIYKIERLKDLKKNNKKFKLYNLNLENKNNLKKIKEKKIDSILHLAAKPGVFESETNPQIYIKKNLLMLTNILQYSKNNKIKYFYFGSSSSVYGGENFMENNKKLNPQSIYGLTKKMGEELVNYFSIRYKIKSLSLRFFTVYGTFGRPDMSYYKFLLLNKSNKFIKVYNHGNNTRPFTNVYDLIFILDKLFNTKIQKRIFKKEYFDTLNIGGDKYYSVKQMLSILKKIDKKINFKIKYLKLMTIDPVVTKAKCEKLRNYIGKYKFIPLEKGMRIFYKWFKNYRY